MGKKRLARVSRAGIDGDLDTGCHQRGCRGVTDSGEYRVRGAEQASPVHGRVVTDEDDDIGLREG